MEFGVWFRNKLVHSWEQRKIFCFKKDTSLMRHLKVKGSFTRPISGPILQ